MKIGEQIHVLKAERDAAIVRLLKEGCTYLRVAELVGCSIGQIQHIAKEHGLLRRSQHMDVVPEGTGKIMSADEMTIILGGHEDGN